MIVAVAKGLSPAEIYALPASVDLPEACKALGIGRTTGYALAAADEFPCRVLRVGRLYKVPRSGILEALDMPEQPPAPERGAA